MNILGINIPEHIRVLSLDVHGTLVLPKPDIGTLYSRFAVEANYFSVDSLEKYAALINANFKDAFMATKTNVQVPYGQDEEDALAFWSTVITKVFVAAEINVNKDFCEKVFYAFARGELWAILPQVREFLSAAQDAGLTLCTCTNFDARVRQILDDLQLADFFAKQYISSEYGMAKPEPLMLLEMAKDQAVAPAQIFHFGDRPSEDELAAQRAGAGFYLIERGKGFVS